MRKIDKKNDWWLGNVVRELNILKEQLKIFEKYDWQRDSNKVDLFSKFPVETILMNGQIEKYLEGQFKQNLRKIGFSMSYAIFENQILYLCEQLFHMKEVKKNIFQHKKIPKIEDMKKFLIIEYEIDFTDCSDLWEIILTYKDIRNIFLHYNGFMRPGDKRERKIKDFIATYGNLDFNENLRIISIKEDFCNIVIETLIKFCSKFYSEH